MRLFLRFSSSVSLFSISGWMWTMIWISKRTLIHTSYVIFQFYQNCGGIKATSVANRRSLLKYDVRNEILLFDISLFVLQQNCKLVMCTRYNRSPKSPFNPQKGLFQNDEAFPLFPIVKHQYRSLQRAEEWIQKTSDGAQSFGHLQCGSIVKSKCIFHLLPLLFSMATLN